MENASTALLISGGILLGILCITILVYAFTSLSTLGNAAAEKEDTRRIAEWNAEWQAYNKQVLYGADIITVMNKAKEYEGSIYELKVTAKDRGEFTVEDIQAGYKKKIFKCTTMIDDNEDGRIDTIEFELVQ